MSRIFLSHSSKNNFEAIALRDWLAAQGWDDLFLDLDPERGIGAGERWERALNEAAMRCEAVRNPRPLRRRPRLVPRPKNWPPTITTLQRLHHLRRNPSARRLPALERCLPITAHRLLRQRRLHLRRPRLRPQRKSRRFRRLRLPPCRPYLPHR